VDEVERRRAAGDLDRVDVRLDEEPGLLGRRPAVEVRDRREPDLSPLVGVAEALDLEEPRRLGRPRLEQLGQLRVGVPAVVLDRLDVAELRQR
jgi:hypothetical protein